MFTQSKLVPGPSKSRQLKLKWEKCFHDPLAIDLYMDRSEKATHNTNISQNVSATFSLVVSIISF